MIISISSWFRRKVSCTVYVCSVINVILCWIIQWLFNFCYLTKSHSVCLLFCNGLMEQHRCVLPKSISLKVISKSETTCNYVKVDYIIIIIQWNFLAHKIWKGLKLCNLYFPLLFSLLLKLSNFLECKCMSTSQPNISLC